MSRAETILEFLERFPSGVCDDCVSRETGIEPRQQVNQLSRLMEQRRALARRRDRCASCGKVKLVNVPWVRADETGINTSLRGVTMPAAAPTQDRATAGSIEAFRNHLDRFCKALAQKHKGPAGKNHLAALILALTDQGIVPMHQANMMHTIRSLRNAYVHEHIRMGSREMAIAQAAWDIIREWAEREEKELWRRTAE